MHRAHDVPCTAASLQYGGLAMAADVAQQLNTVFVAHQHAGAVLPFQHMEIAEIWHEQFVPDITRPMVEQHALFDFQYLGIEMPV